MNHPEKNSQIDLRHWDLIRTLSLEESALLISGIDPAGYDEDSKEYSRAIVYERAISEAVQRANDYAWQHAKKLDRLLLYSEANSDEISQMQGVDDIWEVSGFFEDYLPTIEIRNSISAVNSDPVSVPILLAVDPWYTATVYGGDFNNWLSRSEIVSAYSFKVNQAIVITDKESNWDSEQNRLERESKETNPIPLESANRFAEKIDASKIPLSTRERNTLLSIVAALCKEAKIDYSRPAKAAALVKDLTTEMGLSVGESTIESHLKRVPEALATRMK